MGHLLSNHGSCSALPLDQNDAGFELRKMTPVQSMLYSPVSNCEAQKRPLSRLSMQQKTVILRLSGVNYDAIS